jgi:hypothetical protein
VCAEFSIGFGGDRMSFSLATIPGRDVLAPIVFDNSRITKMHISLPLQLFSPVTFSWILETDGLELVLAAWCLLTAVLTLPEFNTRTRCDFFETGFWFLSLSELFSTQVGLPPGIEPKRDKDHQTLSPDTKDQLRDGRNTFASLLSIICTSPTPICFNRFVIQILYSFFGRKVWQLLFP